MSKLKTNRKLKNILINPSYQIRYVFWLSLTGLSLIALNASIFYFKMKENYEVLVDLSPMTDDSKKQLYTELNHVVITLVISSIIFLLVVSIFGLIFSHRTAGPLYHFKRVFSEIKKGNRKARVKLRPNDDFSDVANEFNEMMDSL